MSEDRKKRRPPFGVRFTEEELTAIYRDAAEAGISPHALVRARSTGRPVTAQKRLDQYRGRLLGKLQRLNADGKYGDLVAKLRDLIMEPPGENQ